MTIEMLLFLLIPLLAMVIAIVTVARDNYTFWTAKEDLENKAKSGQSGQLDPGRSAHNHI
jgi:hypothetical protein